MNEDVARLERAALAAIEREQPLNARALQLLLRRYQSGALSDPHVPRALGGALAGALITHTADATVSGRAAWVELFVESVALSDDSRLIDALGALTNALRRSWTAAPLGEHCVAIGACLYAAGLDAFRTMAPDGIDELERTVGGAYEPGEPFGSFGDRVRAASALLVAFSLSGRLPYSMLAEELMQMRPGAADADFQTACDAARVYGRLAHLHDDADYRRTAVIAPDADYRADASRLLDACAAEAAQRGTDGAIYAIARLELEFSR